MIRFRIARTKQETGSALPSDGDRLFRKVIEYGLLGLIIFSPLPAASVYEWSILVIQLTSLAMGTAYLLMKEKPFINPHLSRSLKWPGLAFAAFLFWTVVQLVPLPKFIVRIISPQAYTFREQFAPNFSDTAFMTLSLVPSHTLREILELVSYLLVGFLVLATVTRRHQIRRLLLVLVGMGVFQAFYGLFELSRENPRILFYKKIYSPDSVTGTFVNRNHLSGYLEMIIPLAIGLVIARIDFFSLLGKKGKEKIISFFGPGFSVNLILTLGILVMSLGIIFSNSRLGIFLLAFSFLLFIELTVLYFGGFNKPRQAGIKNFLRVVFVMITVISLVIGIGATIGRFSLDNLLAEGRPMYWSHVLTMIRDYPVFGTGLGTFGAVYSSYEEAGGEDMILLHAHNDYLEFISELGIVGALFLLGGVFFMLVRTFLIWKQRRNPEVKGLALGGIVSVVLMLVHSFTDFNLHIPANILLFTVVLSLTAVIAHYKKA